MQEEMQRLQRLVLTTSREWIQDVKICFWASRERERKRETDAFFRKKQLFVLFLVPYLCVSPCVFNYHSLSPLSSCILFVSFFLFFVCRPSFLWVSRLAVCFFVLFDSGFSYLTRMSEESCNFLPSLSLSFLSLFLSSFVSRLTRHAFFTASVLSFFPWIVCLLSAQGVNIQGNQVWYKLLKILLPKDLWKSGGNRRTRNKREREENRQRTPGVKHSSSFFLRVLESFPFRPIPLMT